MPIEGMSQEEIDEATRAQVASGAKSTDRINRLEGETASEANARITAAYKEMTAKPIPSKAQTDAGMYVQYVRTEKGGVGHYQALKPVGYTGPNDKITKWTPGVIPANIKRTTGTSIGYNPDDYKTEEDLQRLAAKVSRGGKLTIDEQAFMNRGVKPATTSSTSTTKVVDPLAGKTPDQIAAYDNAKATAQQFVDLYGGSLTDYFDNTTGKVTSPSRDVINKKFAAQNVLKFGDPGYVLKPGDPGYVAPRSITVPDTTDSTNTTYATGTENQYNDRMSVYATMADRFKKYGLIGLANKIKELAMKGASEATITLELQDTPEYQQRFSANADRIKKGLAVLTPAEYVNVEDSYRQVLRAYGLKQFDNDAYVKQFIANDMSPTELSNRVVTAVQRVQNADPAIINQLKTYYGIGSQDMVAYVLDPEQQFQKIQRQVAAAEIGVAAGRQGLTAGLSVAEQLAAQGVTEAEAQKGYATIADILPGAEKLSNIYGATQDRYGQSEGEQEVFNSLASAQRKRQRLSATEMATFSASAGTNRASLTSEKSAGQI